MESFAWEDVKEFYKAHFGISNWVVEMLANMDILMLCASGASNETISTFLELPLDEIGLVIKEVFGFPGWEQDLPLNPYKLYKEYLLIEGASYKDWTNMVKNSLANYPEFHFLDSEELSEICYILGEIEERIYDEWN